LPRPRRTSGGWRQRAECAARGLDPELFYPQVGQVIDQVVFSACSACAVRRECLREAMATEPDVHGRRYGILGGLTARQRTNLAAGKPVKTLVKTRIRNAERRRTAAGRAAATV
jgi:transcription factor WhiB